MTPKYEIIRQTILKQIESGTLQPDEKLPPEENLANEYGVSLITVRHAMTALAEAGVIKRIKGQGSFVMKSRPPVRENGSEKLIAFMLNHDNNAAVSVTRIVAGVQEVLSRKGYRLLVEWNVNNRGIEKQAIDRMLADRVWGAIVYPYNPDDDIKSYEYIGRMGLPYVLIDRYPKDYTCDYVGSDNFAGGRLAANALTSRGHKKLACCCDSVFLSSQRERIAGFTEAAEDADAEYEIYNLNEINGSEMVHKLRQNGVTGIFGVSDRIAARTIQRLNGEGFQVPQDFSVIGFDDCWYDATLKVPFASIRQDFRGLGAAAAKRLLERIERVEETLCTKTVLSVEPVERSTSLSRLVINEK